jgi:DNA segregation ATPase FtsK/SpoIIIE-like protein
MIEAALALIRKNPERITISFTQRNLRIGYNQAARILEHLEKTQYIAPNKTFGWTLL